MMTGPQYTAALEQLKLTPRALSKLFDVDYATTKRWRQRGVEGPPAILVQLMLAGRVKPVHLTKPYPWEVRS